MANNIPVLLGTQPRHSSEDRFRLHMDNKPYNDIVVYPQHEQFVKHHAAFKQTIQSLGAELGVAVVDNNANLSGADEYFADFIHYSEAGVRKLAESYATAIATDPVLRKLLQSD